MDRETPIGLDANHSNICKFGAINDNQYEQVEGNIMELAKNALLAVKEQTRLAKSSVPITIGLGLVSVPTRMILHPLTSKIAVANKNHSTVCTKQRIYWQRVHLS